MWKKSLMLAVVIILMPVSVNATLSLAEVLSEPQIFSIMDFIPLAEVNDDQFLIVNQSNEALFTKSLDVGSLQKITAPQLSRLNTNFTWNGTHFVLAWDGIDNSKKFGYRVFALTNISGNEVRRYVPEDTNQCVNFGWNKSRQSFTKWKHTFWIQEWQNTGPCQNAKNNLEYVGLEFFWENVTPVINHSTKQIMLDELAYDYNDIPLSGLDVVKKGNVLEIHNVKALQKILVDPEIISTDLSTSSAQDHMYPLARTNDNIYHTVWRDSAADLSYARSLDYGLTWDSQVLDDTGTVVAATIVTNSTNGIWVIYAETVGDDIKYVSSSDIGLTWSAPAIIPDFDGDTSHEFPELSATMDYNDQIHVCIVTGDWGGTANDFLMYSNYTSAGWFGMVNVSINASDDSDRCDIDVDSNNLPYIVSVGSDGDDVDFWYAGNWGYENKVSVHSSTGDNDVRMVIDQNDVIHLVWEELTWDVGYGNSTPDHPTSWTTVTVSNFEQNDEPAMITTPLNEIFIIHEGGELQDSIWLHNSTDNGTSWFNQTLHENDTTDGLVQPIMRRSHQPYDLTNYRLDYTYRNTSGSDTYYFDTFVIDETVIVGFIPPSDDDNTAKDSNHTRPSFQVNISGTLNYSLLNWNGTNISLMGRGIYAIYHLDNYTGDSSGNGRHLSPLGPVNCSEEIDGQFGSACKFSGLTDRLDLPDNNDFTGVDFTLMAWFNTSNINQPIESQSIIIKADEAFTENYALGIDIDGDLNWGVQASCSGSFTDIEYAITANEWWHVAAHFENGVGHTLFVNGVKVNSSTAVTSIDSCFSVIGIGRSPRDSDTFNGSIDEVRFYTNINLTPEEINVLYRSEVGRFYVNLTTLRNGTYNYNASVRDSDGNVNTSETRTICIGTNFAQDCTTTSIDFVDPTDADNALVTRNHTLINLSITNTTDIDTVGIEWNGTNITVWGDGLIAHWSLNNHTDDSSRNGLNGTNLGANCSTVILGKFGTACEFDGISSNLTVPFNPALNIDGDQITIEAWVKLNSIPTTKATILAKSGLNNFYKLRIDSANPESSIDTGVGLSCTDSVTALVVNVFYHIAATYNGTHQAIYVNGNRTTTCTDTGTIDQATEALTIGADTGSTARRLNGTIDEVRIWNRSLSEEEIEILYRSEIGQYYVNITENTFDANYSYYGWFNQTDAVFEQTATRNITFSEIGAELQPFNVTVQISPDTNITINSTNTFTINSTVTCYGGGCGNLNLTIMTRNLNSISYNVSTIQNGTQQNDTSILIDFDIENEQDAQEVMIEWNGTNITLFGNKIVGLLNLDNNTADHSNVESDYSGVNFGANCSSEVIGYFGSACEFRSNEGDYINLSRDNAFGGNDGDFAVSAWVRKQNKGNDTPNQDVVNRYAGHTVGVRTWSLYLTKTFLNKANFAAYELSNSVSVTSNPIDEWFNVLGIYNGTHTSLWFNGTREDVDDASGSMFGGGGIDITVGGSPQINDYFNGTIDQVVLYNFSMNSSEVDVYWRSLIGSYFINVTHLKNGTYKFRGVLTNDNDDSFFTEYRTICVGTDFAQDCPVITSDALGSNEFDIIPENSGDLYVIPTPNNPAMCTLDLNDFCSINWTLNITSAPLSVFDIFINVSNTTTSLINLSSHINLTVGQTPIVPSGCTYPGSGQWNIDCTDACTIETPTDLAGENIIFSGDGQITITADITTVGDVAILNQCRVICDGGCIT